MSLYVGRQSYGASFGASFGSSGLKGVVTLAAPVNTGAPSISGFAAPGNVLTANNGAWTGYPNPTYAYQWKADASNIVGETGATYSVVLADVGKTISVSVTATNSEGNASASATGVAIASDPPVNTVAPAISGTATVGAALSVSNGTWSGHPAATFAYQWKRNGSNISSATSNTYTLVSADAGNPITCTVTATNTSGSASATSSATSNVTSAPANTVAPAISGTTGLGDTLTVSSGTWTGSPTPSYAYQWTRDGSNIAAATSATYVIVTADGGHTVACVVTATNSVGSGSSSATGSSVSVFTSPSNTVAPTISGTANVGSTLTASTGTWTGNPSSFSYAYQWYWGDTVTPISGATSSTYTPVSGDAGHTIIVNVTATNAIGSTSQGSSATSAVSASPTIPSGALGVWSFADYSSTGGAKIVPNSVAATAAQPNLLNPASRHFKYNQPWQGAITVTDNYAAGPDGLANGASRIVGTGDCYLATNLNPVLSAGTYTLAIDVKSNTGSTQNVRIQLFSAGLTVSDTATTSWKTILVTGSCGSGEQLCIPIRSDGTNGLDVLVANARLFAGSSDLGAEVLAGHLHLGINTSNNAPTYSSGVLDTSATNCIGNIQFPVTSIQDFTFSALVKKISAGNDYQGMLSAGTSDSFEYTKFGMLADQASVPAVGAAGGLEYYGSLNTGLWDLQTDAGYHMVTHRYDAATLSMCLFLDDVLMTRIPLTISASNMADFWFNVINGPAFSGKLKYAGKMGFWNRKLSNQEVRDFYSISKDAAVAAGVTVTPVARVLVSGGDSNTVGIGTPGYPFVSAGSVTNKLLGVVNAVAGSTLADINARLAYLTDALPDTGNRTGRKFIFTLLIGTNDLGPYSSEAQYATDLAATLDGLRTAGWYVITITLIDQNDATFQGRDGTLAVTQRTWVGTHADAVADFYANANIGPAGASLSATYFQSDHLHLTATGQGIAAGILTTKLDAA